jgi:hypothetical protein
MLGHSSVRLWRTSGETLGTEQTQAQAAGCGLGAGSLPTTSRCCDNQSCPSVPHSGPTALLSPVRVYDPPKSFRPLLTGRYSFVTSRQPNSWNACHCILPSSPSHYTTQASSSCCPRDDRHHPRARTNYSVQQVSLASLAEQILSRALPHYANVVQTTAFLLFTTRR